MKPSKLGTPERDLGWAEIRPLAENLIQELESQAKKIQELERRRGEAPQPPGRLAEARRLLGNLGLRTADAVTLERQRVLHRAIDETYFRIVIAPGVSFYEGGGITEQVNDGAITMRFPDGSNANFAWRQEPTRELWVRTRPRVYVWYTSPTAGTATFTFSLGLRVFGPGLTTAGAIVGGAALQWTAPGPAGANDVLLTTAVMSAVFPSSPYGVTRARISRIGLTDANNNALDILLAMVVFEEVA